MKMQSNTFVVWMNTFSTENENVLNKGRFSLWYWKCHFIAIFVFNAFQFLSRSPRFPFFSFFYLRFISISIIPRPPPASLIALHFASIMCTCKMRAPAHSLCCFICQAFLLRCSLNFFLLFYFFVWLGLESMRFNWICWSLKHVIGCCHWIYTHQITHIE